MAACAKHFLGDCGTHNGINENNTIIGLRGLMGIQMRPYFDSIIKGVSTVMVSYSSWNGKKMHADQELVTDFLKQKLGFQVYMISFCNVPSINDHRNIFFSEIYSLKFDFQRWIVLSTGICDL